MKISEKKDLFQLNQLSIEIIEKNSLGLININYDKYLSKLIFEKSVIVDSPTITKAGQIFFGAYSYMNDSGYVRDNVFIGRYCSIGRRVTIGAAQHQMSSLSTSPSIYGVRTSSIYTESELLLVNQKKTSEFTSIMNDVWIGDGVVIPRGITVGSGAVIGSNSVVTKDIPPYAIVGGVPARILKYRFPEEIIAKLISLNWWECEPETLSRIPTDNIFEFIRVFSREKDGIQQSDFKSYIIPV